MKNVTSALENYLLTQRNIQACDIYELVLHNGHHYYYADMDADITDNSKVYRHDGLMFEREQVQLNSTVVVDTMSITIKGGKNDNLEGMSFVKAVHTGVLDRAKLYLRRCFFRDSQIIGCIDLFGGLTEVTSAGGLVVSLDVKAETSGLNMEFPIRKYYPQGSFSTDKDGIVTIKDSDDIAVVAPFKPQKEVLL